MHDAQDGRPTRHTGRRLRRLAFGVACVVALLAAGMAFVSVAGFQVRAPDYLRDRIAARINDDIAGFELDVGAMSLALRGDWRPTLRLREVNIRRPDGAVLARLSDVTSRVALVPLLRGRVQPAAVRLSGARVKLLRAADGGVNVSVGETGPALGEAANFGALAARADDLLTQPHFARLDRVEAGNLTLRYEDARAGRAWTVDGGRLEMTRQAGAIRMRGDFALLGARDYATTLEMNYSSRIGETAAEFGVKVEDMPANDIAGQSPALAWLNALDAPISGALRAGVDDDGDLTALNATLRIGAGVLKPTEATRPVAFNAARTYFTYDPAEQRLVFDELFVDSDWMTARAEGQAKLVDLRDGWPSEILGQFRFGEISANPAGLYPDPVTLETVAADMRLRLDPFELTLGQMSLADRGQRLVMDGMATAGADGWNVKLDGRMDGIAPDRLLALWPERVKEKTRRWISENVRDVALSDIQFAVRSVPGHRPDVFLGFDFAGLETRFVKEVPPITGAAGHASLHDGKFVVHAREGRVPAAQGGAVDIAGTSFIVPDVRIKRGPARVRLRTDGTITAALSLLDEEPFRFMQKAGRPVTLADGRAALTGRLDFLLKDKLQPEEVAFDVSGTLSEIRSEALVQDRVLRASSLDLTARNTGLEIRGAAQVGQVPVEGRWQTPLGPGRAGGGTVTGWIELSERFADEFRIGLPPGSISGAGRADMEISFDKDAPARFTLSSDLAGVGLRLRQLDWALAPASTGRLEVRGVMGDTPRIDRVALEAAGLDATGEVRLRDNGRLDRAVFSRVRLEDWLDAPVTLVGREAGATPEVRVSGGTVDLRRTSLSGEGAGGASRPGGPVTLRLDRLQVSDGIALTGFSADLNTAGGTRGSFSGRVNGGAVINGEVVPQAGRSAFRLSAADAGGILSSAGLLKRAREGRLELVLTPAPAAGSYDGRLTARDIRLTDAPALATLLNTLSVVGILDQLDGEGIHFSDVTARFRLTPERVALLSSSAVGASMGITMDGYYDPDRELMDMQGVVSPFYLVNSIGGIFTRQGEGLFGFNYALSGPASDPSVQVNPLSALTPGMFREIFRRPAPRVGSSGQMVNEAPPERERTDGRPAGNSR